MKIYQCLLIPTEYKLYQNYPNPFNPKTIIKYEIPFTGKVNINVFDALGRKVLEAADEIQTAGMYETEKDNNL